ncbi:DNA polymerase alpha B-subunit [Schizosaccharomyces japonicus yFS275]|uniref:DNA polymerase alpha subunit B n=1 Tax=Schizosaccharomyces japonicus (strain yFS275 / FY16936) TaxID=402676 RepID=B6K1R0_SCHJY|nr:DNA polymerase alpha B-subunit [Schizosaccharomyces japonicus yFS275]EEB07091.1 DNA polymerase alpha B-subunit [Schizosaccharomyces japonicus yFS275]
MEFPNDPVLSAEKEALLKTCAIDEQEMFFKWESWCIQTGHDADVNLKSFQQFAEALKRQMERKVKAEMKPKVERKTVKHIASMDLGNILGVSTKQNSLQNDPNAVGDSASKPVELSKESGKVLEILHPRPNNAENLNRAEHTTQSVSIVPEFEAAKFHYRYMYQKLQDSSEVLDDRIDAFSELTCQVLGIQDEELANPGELTQDTVIVVGRIVLDSSAPGGRLNAQSILLETSRRLGAGCRVPLRLDNLSGFSIFPGKVVALKGSNPSGKVFTASEFVKIPPLPLATSDAQPTSDDMAVDAMSQNTRVLLASGPWCVRDNFEYTPLRAFVEHVVQEQPDAVILMGPFIDVHHPFIEIGVIPNAKADSVEGIFQQFVTPILSRITCPCILIPHMNELVTDHPVWPQDSLDPNLLKLPSNFKCFPNPSVFSINDTRFGISTNDILLHMSKEELFRSPKHTNLFTRLASNIIQQRHFYPLFPGGSMEKGNSSNLDISHLPLGEFINVTPKILILPSELHHFAKDVENVVSVNPGKATKGVSFGSFARINIAPKEISTDGNTNSNHIHVEIVRL